MSLAYMGSIPIIDEKDDWVQGTHLYFSQNQLSVDDDMLLYNTRSVNFMNYEPQSQTNFRVLQSITYYADENDDEIKDLDCLYVVGLNLSQRGKSYTRVRRKFVDDVATRGG